MKSAVKAKKSCVIQTPNVKVGSASSGQRSRTSAAIGL